MYQELVHIRLSLHHGLLLFLLTVFTQDLSNGRGVQAWTYNYSTSPTRDWWSARRWCQVHFTDMVAIQNQEETAYLNQLLPFIRTYYWIGIRKVKGVWTWLGTNKSLSLQAENWATGEPNNIQDGEDCVEIYIKRDKDMTKWNDERCKKKKGTICYKASCSQDSCGIHGDCVETIGNYTCQCHPGFQGMHCEEEISCGALLDPEKGSVYCDHVYGLHHFNSSCQFLCDLGYHLVGAPRLLCQANGNWDNPAPLCQVEQCSTLELGLSGGKMNCSHPIALNSYNSTCEVKCDEGHDLDGHNVTYCDHTGHWTSNDYKCTVTQCVPISSPIAGNMTCRDPLGSFSFGSTCSFTCLEGYSLTGHNTLTCQASGNWSAAVPECTVVQCSSLKAPLYGSMQCQDLVEGFSYGSMCTIQCNEGFDLIGNNFTQCSSMGNWSNTLPVCQARQCSILTAAPHQGWMNCSHPYFNFSHSSQCTFGCREGFWLKGASTIQCNTSGLWSHELPTCQVTQCTPISSPIAGKMTCRDTLGSFSFGSTCGFTCFEGYSLTGHNTLACQASGHWSRAVPECKVTRCDVISVPSWPLYMNCSHPLGNFSYGSQCLFSCEVGYAVNGTEELFCSPNGDWDHGIPTCKEEDLVGTALLVFIAVGGGFAAVLLSMIGLLILHKKQKTGGIVNLENSLWEERENPAFEL